eukprot:8515386-Pyramimonas_sp.AAC.1
MLQVLLSVLLLVLLLLVSDGAGAAFAAAAAAGGGAAVGVGAAAGDAGVGDISGFLGGSLLAVAEALAVLGPSWGISRGPCWKPRPNLYSNPSPSIAILAPEEAPQPRPSAGAPRLPSSDGSRQCAAVAVVGWLLSLLARTPAGARGRGQPRVTRGK